MNKLTQVETRPDGTVITTTVEIPEFPEQVASTETVEEYAMVFSYHGCVRKVVNPHITRGRFAPLLGGVELERDGVETGTFKYYALNLIEPV